jgi:signal transduction histidine kinase
VSATPSPNADPGVRRSSLRERVGRGLHRLAPRSFQARLTIGFFGVLALTLTVVSGLVINRMDDYFRQQQQGDLEARALTVAQYVAVVAEGASGLRPVVGADNVVDPDVALELSRSPQHRILADQLAQADVRVRLGLIQNGQFAPASNGSIEASHQAETRPGQTREPLTSDQLRYAVNTLIPYVIEVTLSNPYTYRASTISNIAGLLLVTGLFAMGLAIIVAAALTLWFTIPLRRLTEASRGLAEGDLSRRVEAPHVRAGSLELADLSTQFNAMADRLQESVEIIRRDRDRSRDFLADVSHELRTPIAALRTFNELLKDPATDPTAQAEFLDSSGQQIERLDWLAQNLLELSKLDSGLVLLDLRPDDLRAAVESAVEQSEAAARRRGVELQLHVPDHPLRIRHDPLRIGQVVANLVGNAVKFTPRDGHVSVTVKPWRTGARIEVSDTGVGIDATELPHVFERFYRGSQANEARGSGSGLGLAIVRSIVDMHHGTVTVSSRLGVGTTFVVTLPRDPRAGEEPGAAGDRGARERERKGRSAPDMADSSLSGRTTLNNPPSPSDALTPTNPA